MWTTLRHVEKPGPGEGAEARPGTFADHPGGAGRPPGRRPSGAHSLRDRFGLGKQAVTDAHRPRFAPFARDQKYPEAVASLLAGINNEVARQDKQTAEIKTGTALFPAVPAPSWPPPRGPARRCPTPRPGRSADVKRSDSGPLRPAPRRPIRVPESGNSRRRSSQNALGPGRFAAGGRPDRRAV